MATGTTVGDGTDPDVFEVMLSSRSSRLRRSLREPRDRGGFGVASWSWDEDSWAVIGGGGFGATVAGTGAELPSSTIAAAVSKAVLLTLERRGPARPRSRWRMAATPAALPRSLLLSLLGFSASPPGLFSVFAAVDAPPGADILLSVLLNEPYPDPSRLNDPKPEFSRLKIVAVSISTALTACLIALSSLSVSSLSFPLPLLFSSFLFSDLLEEASFPSFPSFDLSDLALPPGADFSAAAVAFCCRRKSMRGVVLGFSGFSPDGSGTDSGSLGITERSPMDTVVPSDSGAVPSDGPVSLDVGTAEVPLRDATKLMKSGSLSMVPALASILALFFGNFWNGEYSICGLVVLPFESVNEPCERRASLSAVI